MQPRERTIAGDDPVAAAARGEGLSGLEYMHAIAAGEIPPPPIAVLLGFALVEVEEGRAVFAVSPRSTTTTRSASSTAGSRRHCSTRRWAARSTSTLGRRRLHDARVKVNFARAITGDTGRVVCEGTVSTAADDRDRRGPGDRRGDGQAARPRHHNLPAVRHKRHLRGSDPLALGRVRGSDPPYTRAGGRQLAGRLGCAVQRLLPACVRRRRACRGDLELERCVPETGRKRAVDRGAHRRVEQRRREPAVDDADGIVVELLGHTANTARLGDGLRGPQHASGRRRLHDAPSPRSPRHARRRRTHAGRSR